MGVHYSPYFCLYLEIFIIKSLRNTLEFDFFKGVMSISSAEVSGLLDCGALGAVETLDKVQAAYLGGLGNLKLPQNLPPEPALPFLVYA